MKFFKGIVIPHELIFLNNNPVKLEIIFKTLHAKKESYSFHHILLFRVVQLMNNKQLYKIAWNCLNDTEISNKY